MLTRNTDLRTQAFEALHGNWAVGVMITLTYAAIYLLSSALSAFFQYSWGGLFDPQTDMPGPLFFSGSLITVLVSILILLPLYWAVQVGFLRLFRREELEASCVFEAFKGGKYKRVLGTVFLQNLYIFLWSLLFVIPGIIKTFSYAMTSYILKDRPELAYNTAIDESMRLMNGNKMKLFLMHLSFIGWGLLCILTFGIGFLWLIPYVQTSVAAFYEDLVREDAEMILGTII